MNERDRPKFMSECEEEKLNIDILAEERGYVSNEKQAKNSRHELGMLLRWLSTTGCFDIYFVEIARLNNRCILPAVAE